MRLDDVLNAIGGNRDYLILALAVLVLVEGGIIVLWARKGVRLGRELQAAVASAEAAKVAAERAAAAAAEMGGTYRAASRREREVYSVAGRDSAHTTADALVAPPMPRRATDVASPAALGVAPAPGRTPEPARAPEPIAAAEEAAQPPADYVNPVAEKAAAWVIPEVEASRNGAADEPAAANGNGHNGNGWFPAPTTLGWSGQAVPVEPAADFAVLSERDVPTKAPEQAPNGSPSLTVLDGATKTWSFPAPPTPQAPPAQTHFDPAMFDINDDGVPDDLPISGDVLLVEDDPAISRLYRMLLESRGYTVRCAGDGVEGLDRTNEKRPDLVLLDIMMPRMNGIAFLQALRAGEMRDVPVVVLSNFMEKQLVDDAMSLGALEYMVKAQTRPEALVGALPHWLRGERAFSF
ncbi:MAG TPA: response regulator [Candidatus Angelobacter sp.]|jgi:CheY-like chemotaxis protein|nr:response regulator [Candidatus Angelobacter sp.]